MNYRIRFRQSDRPRDEEVVVEAHTPTEALVKFRCLRPDGRSMAASTVTSVSPTDLSDSLAW